MISVSKVVLGGAAALFGAGAFCLPCGQELAADGTAPSTESRASVAGGSHAIRPDTARARLAIEGMTCGSCAATARIALERVDGVYRADVSFDSASAVVLYDPAKTTPNVFIPRLEKLTGYQARPADG